MFLVWLACTDPPDPPDAPSGLPEIEAALAGRCPDPTPHRRLMPLGSSLHRVTLDGEARCNDGSPPVIYVRAATDPAHAADWVLHLEGGGLCSSAEECAVRWCGEDNYDAANMSSRWSLGEAGAEGIASDAPGNTFAGWNQVELHYCSSDFWTGQAAEVQIEADPPYVLHFQGHEIVGDALDALVAGVVSDDGVESLPSLLPAGTVLFGGSSAGGYGTMTELGRVVDALPGARVIGVPDAAFSPAAELLSPALAAAVADQLETQWTDYVEPLWQAYVDPSCAAATDEPWRCIDLDHLFRGPGARPGEVEVVYHHDLYDPVLFGFFSLIGFDIESYPAAGAETLRALGASPGISVHGTACADHTALDGDDSFFRMSVADPAVGFPRLSLHDTLVAVLGGREVSVVDDPDRTGSFCPALPGSGP